MTFLDLRLKGATVADAPSLSDERALIARLESRDGRGPHGRHERPRRAEAVVGPRDQKEMKILRDLELTWKNGGGRSRPSLPFPACLRPLLGRSPSARSFT